MKSRYIAAKPQELADEGHHEGVIAAVDYKPEVQTDFGIQNQVRLRIDTDQDGEDGDPVPVFLTLHDSLHPSARLYQVLVALKTDPKPGFDFNTLLGLPVEFEVEHNIGQDGRTWNNIKNKDLHLKRTAKERAADERSLERIRQATEGIRQQQQPKSKTPAPPPPKEEARFAPKKNGGVKSQWEGAKKKATPRPEAEEYEDNEPLFPPEDEQEITDEDIPE